jgi:bifunctional non-homologous end joining protein LigD
VALDRKGVSSFQKHFGSLLAGYFDRNQLKFAGKAGTGFKQSLLRNLYEQLEAIRIPKCPFVNLRANRKSRHGQSVAAAVMRRCHWVKPDLVCQIKFSEWTRDAKMREPVFLGLREDKAAVEVVRERAG